MEELIERKRKRFEFLNCLYKKSNGNLRYFITMGEIGDELGFSREETMIIFQYLRGESLVRPVASGGLIAITHEGVKEIEMAISEPKKETKYFPPISNIIYVENMNNSQPQIQQGTNDSTQTGSFNLGSIQPLEEFIKDFKEKLNELKLSQEDNNDAQAEIATIESQLTSSKPKHIIITECLKSLRTIMERAAGTIAGSLLLQKIVELLQNH